jgi:hypothetical protein
MTTKVPYKLYLPYELGRQVEDAHKQFSSAGRKVSRNEVFQQLIEDGFKMWRREKQQISRVETTLATLLDRATQTDKLVRSILLTLAEGDQEEVARLIQTIEKGEPNHA